MRLRSTVILAAIAVLAVAGFLARDSLFGREELTVVKIVFEKPVCTQFAIFRSPEIEDTSVPLRFDISADDPQGIVLPPDIPLSFQFFQSDGADMERAANRVRSIGSFGNRTRSGAIPAPEDAFRIDYDILDIADLDVCEAPDNNLLSDIGGGKRRVYEAIMAQRW